MPSITKCMTCLMGSEAEEKILFSSCSVLEYGPSSGTGAVQMTKLMLGGGESMQ